MIALLNLFRLFFLLLFFAPVFLFSKERFLYLFLNAAGPSFIKLGQLLSTRPDLVGEKISHALEKFYDDVAPFSYNEVKKILRQEFGKNYKNIFSDFDYGSTASASIAQVHKAQLIDGRNVAVKILRPNIRQTMQRDIVSLKLLTKLAAIFSKFLAKTLRNIVLLLENVAKYELDLLHEAANASRLREDLKDVKGFYVPEIFWQYSTPKILVLEWLDGISFADKKAIAQTPFDKKQIAQNLVISYFNQVYGHGFFHADMHPGNLFLLKNGDIGVVDFGIMGKIDKKTRIAIAEILIGFLNRDYKKVAQLHLDADLVPAYTNIDDLALSCRRIGETIVGADVKDIPVAKLLSGLIDMTREYKMDTRPDLLLLQKTILIVEGVGVSLDPELNIWNLARPWIKDWAKKNIGFDAKLRDGVIDLIEMAKRFVRSV